MKQIKKKKTDVEIKVSFPFLEDNTHLRSDKFRRLLDITNDQPHSYYTRCSHV